MMSKIILNGLTTDEFKELVTHALKQVLHPNFNIQPEPEKEKDEFATRMETARLLKITLPTLHDWTKRGIVQSYKIGKRVLYKLEEVKSALHKRNFQALRIGGSNA